MAIAVPDPDLARSLDPLDVRDETISGLLAWTAPEPCAADIALRKLRFPIRLLGRGIRVDDAHPIDVTVAAPEGFDASAVTRLSVVQGGRVLGMGTSTVAVTLVDRETPLELEMELTRNGMAKAAARFAASGAPPLSERLEPGQPDLVRLRPPRAGTAPGSYRVSTDVARLLLNPLAGHGEPLGRRMHPLSGLGVGASLTAAFGLAGESAPDEPHRARAVALWIRWLAIPDLDLDLEARGRVESSAARQSHRPRRRLRRVWAARERVGGRGRRRIGGSRRPGGRGVARAPAHPATTRAGGRGPRHDRAPQDEAGCSVAAPLTLLQ